MEAGRPSETAVLTATQRGLHRLEEDPPWILDDHYALPLVGPIWTELRARLAPVRAPRAFTVARARFAEDRVLGGSFAQYVIMGAGLDSFAFRKPDALRAGLRVFEVDHPASQAWKRERAEHLSLPSSDRHVFVPVDFESDSTIDRLAENGFDPSKPSFFSWLGVSMYLSPPAIEETLRMVAGMAEGSEIVWTYWVHPDHLDEETRTFRAGVAQRAAESGEPIVTTPTPEEAEAFNERCALETIEHPTSDDLAARYLKGRTDGLVISSGERIILAARR